MKPGDVICVVPDSHQFSEIESKAVWIANGKNANDWTGHTWIIDIPSVAVEAAKKLLSEWVRPATAAELAFNASDPEDRIVKLGERRYRFNSLPENVVNILNRDGAATVTKAQAEQYLEDLNGEDVRFG